MIKSKFRSHALVFVLLVALLFTSVVNAAPKDGPTVGLSVAQGEFSSSQDVTVTVTISKAWNTGKLCSLFIADDQVYASLAQP